jgi:hypothetical protein
MATTVVNELLHHARKDGTFSDSILDRAALRIMSAEEEAKARAEMKKGGYVDGTIGHRAVTANCKATNPYGPPPKSK